LQEDMAIINDPNYTQVTLTGTDNAPSALARVYWNPSKESVYLSVARMDDLPEGKVYQLWALVDGQPVDAGIFTPEDSLIEMKAIGMGQAFAVTIEDEGGAESPALETLQVIGNVATS
ncbi:MAG: anti-sigma factor, partial [Flavobacteriales bacterium]|nr:anti-sigma factor [Flavobacteriales bacterium]